MSSPPLWRDFLGFLWEGRWWWLALLVALAAGVLVVAWLTREPPRPPTYPDLGAAAARCRARESGRTDGKTERWSDEELERWV